MTRNLGTQFYNSYNHHQDISRVFKFNKLNLHSNKISFHKIFLLLNISEFFLFPNWKRISHYVMF